MALYITFIIIIIIILKAHQHKSAVRNTRLDIQNYGRNGNLLCCGKKTAHTARCRAMEKRWKRNVVSRVSSVILAIRLPLILLRWI